MALLKLKPAVAGMTLTEAPLHIFGYETDTDVLLEDGLHTFVSNAMAERHKSNKHTWNWCGEGLITQKHW